jgi:hypothetical protein
LSRRYVTIRSSAPKFATSRRSRASYEGCSRAFALGTPRYPLLPLRGTKKGIARFLRGVLALRAWPLAILCCRYAARKGDRALLTRGALARTRSAPLAILFCRYAARKWRSRASFRGVLSRFALGTPRYPLPPLRGTKTRIARFLRSGALARSRSAPLAIFFCRYAARKRGSRASFRGVLSRVRARHPSLSSSAATRHENEDRAFLLRGALSRVRARHPSLSSSAAPRQRKLVLARALAHSRSALLAPLGGKT